MKFVGSARFLFPRSEPFVERDGAVEISRRSQFQDAVRDGFREFVVLGAKENRSLVSLESVVQRGNRFEVEMRGRFVEHQHIRVRKHHAAEHAADLFAAGKHLGGFERLFAGEEHPSEESADERFVLFLAELPEPIDEGKVRVEERVVVLGKIARRNGRSPFDLSRFDVPVVLDGFEECGFENAAVADERHLVLAAERKVQMFELGAVSRRNRQVLDFEYDFSRFAVHFEADPRELAARSGHFLDGHLVEKLFAAGRLFRLGRVRGEALDERLEFRDFFLGAAVLVLALLLGELARLVPKFVVARIQVHAAVVDVANVRADRVQKVSVVRNDDDRVFEAFQVILEPADAFEVEVVRRFVEQKDVRVAEERLGEKDADLFVAVEFLHEFRVGILGDAETLEKRSRGGFRLVSAHFAEFRFEVYRLHAFRFGHFRFGVKFLAAFSHLVKFGVSHHDGVEDGEFLECEVVLFEDGDAFARVVGDVARVRFEFARKDFQERGFPGAVRADDPVAISLAEREVDFLEKYAASVLQTDIGNIEHEAKDSKFLFIFGENSEVLWQSRKHFKRSKSSCGSSRSPWASFSGFGMPTA